MTGESVRTHVRNILLMAVAACGGARQGGSSALPGNQSSEHTSIGDVALAQGGIASLGGSRPESANVGSLNMNRVQAPIKFDGVPLEWPARVRAGELIKGTLDGGLKFSGAIEYDDAHLYVGGEVEDSTFVRTAHFDRNEDHASLVIAVPVSNKSFAAYEIGLYAGKPGETAGVVRHLSGAQRGQDVAGSKIVEAPAEGGYTFEAQIPWSAFPEARLVRSGLRISLRYYDADNPGTIKTIVATGAGGTESPSALPWVPNDAEQSLIEGLLTPKGLLARAPSFEFYADVAGNSMKERIAIYDHYFTLCGPAYRGGSDFFFRDIGADVVQFESRDVTGRGKEDLLVRRRFSSPSGSREWFEVWSVFGEGEPVTTFSHEIRIASGDKHLDNLVHATPKEIEVSTLAPGGWDAASYHETASSDVEPLLLPWGAVRTQTYHFDGARFVKTKEVTQPAQQPPKEDFRRTASTPPAEIASVPARPTASDLSKQIFDLYKRDRNVPLETRPKFDLRANVAGDKRAEQIMLVDRDLVIFGPGFKGGSGYAFLTLQQFADASDIRELTANDLTGDGTAELIIRAVRHTQGAGGSSSTDSELLMVYTVTDGNVRRIFALETARAQGDKRVSCSVHFVRRRRSNGMDLDVRPGRIIGWTEKTYPWGKEQPGGAIEPLLLPWDSPAEVLYTWDGSQFVRR